MNIFTPERSADESVQQYKQRRLDARTSLRKMTLRGIGVQHKAPSSREQLRNSQRENGTLKCGAYGRGLTNHFDRKLAQQLAARAQKRASG